MNSKEIFSIALNLESPWYIEDIQMSKSDSSRSGQIDIYLNFKSGSKFQDVDGQTCSVHDTVKRSWQHLNFFEHTCQIHARVPRILDHDKKVKTVQVPWSRKNSGFTLLYEAYSMLLIESEMPIKKAAKILKIYDMRLWRIFNYWIGRAFNASEQDDITKIGIDETSTKRGHNYVTVGVDMDKRNVIFATPGKNAHCIEKLQTHLDGKGCGKENIVQASIDMSRSFISGIKNNFPNAQITFDKFHVFKLINEAMDNVRKAERKELVELKGHKYIFLKDQKKLNEKEKAHKYYFITTYPKLGEAYILKEMFGDFWDMKSKEEASAYLSFWCDLAVESGIEPFIKAANTIKAHWAGIVNYIESRINNGILEGINSKIQLAKKRARGYRNIPNFINMIYFIAGKLKFDYPLYLR